MTAHTTPKEWTIESRQLAIDSGYLHGALQGGTDEDSAPELPADYTKNAKAVAERQGALAGYRLADEIQRCLKFGGNVPSLPESTFAATKVALPAKIGAAEASKYYDETTVVTGIVAQVTIRPNIVFINFDQPFPNSPLAAVIFPDNVGNFGDPRFIGHST